MRIKQWKIESTPHPNPPPQGGREKRQFSLTRENVGVIGPCANMNLTGPGSSIFGSPPPLWGRARVGGRPAFTLIELIIVIAIIAILAALTTGAVMRYYSVQQQTNTEVNIRKLNDALQNQWDTVVRQARDQSEPISPQAKALANYAGTADERVARIIHIKLRLKQEFPMNFTEILNPYTPLNNASGWWDLD